MRSNIKLGLACPMLFLVHINDVHLYIEQCKTIMYADDTVILFSEKSHAEIERAINHDSNLLLTWLCNNGLTLNSNQGKTEFMMFGTEARRKRIESETITKINSKPINITDGYKYLGIHLEQGFLIVLSAGPGKHIDFLRGPLGYQLLHTLCYKATQNETQISFLPG